MLRILQFQAFVAAYESLQRDGVSLSAFVEKYKGPLQLVASVADIKALIDRAGAWSSVHEVLSRVVSASLIGKRMFSFAMVHIIASEVSQTVDSDIAAFFKASDHTTASLVAGLKERLVKAVLAKVGIELLPVKRMVSVVYRTVTLKIPVDSVYDEVDKNIAAHLKTMVVAGELLDPLLCELSLVETHNEVVKIDREVLEPFALARAQANNLLGGVHWTSGEELVEKLTEKQQSLVQLDASFVIEIEFMKSLAGEEGTLMMQQLIMQCLPSATRTMTVTQSAEKLNDLAMSERANFCSSAGKGALNIVKEIVGHLQMKVPPPLTAARGNSFYEQVVSSLSYFVLLEADGADASNERALHGYAALAKQIADIEEVLKVEGAQVPLEQLSDLNIYSFLLTAEEKKKVVGWLKDSIKSMTLNPSVAIVAHEAEKGTAKSQNAKAAKKKSAYDAAKSFFE